MKKGVGLRYLDISILTTIGIVLSLLLLISLERDELTEVLS